MIGNTTKSVNHLATLLRHQAPQMCFTIKHINLNVSIKLHETVFGNMSCINKEGTPFAQSFHGKWL